MSRLIQLRTVSAKIAICFALVFPLVGWSLGQGAYQSWQSYRSASLAAQQNAAANNLIAGVYEILMERLATNNALQADDPAGADVLTEIAKRRSVAVDKIRAAHTTLGGQEFPGRAALLTELKAAMDKADGYRTKADTAVKQGKAARDADTVKNLFVALSELSATSQKVWTAVLANTAKLDPELGRLTNLRILAWNLRDIAGFERSHIAQAIAAKTPIPADKLSAIAEVRAQVTLMWRLLQINLAPQDSAPLLKGLQLAKDGYFGKFQPLADQMRKTSAEGANYPMSVPQWVDATTPLLFTLLEIMYGAGEASEQYTAQVERGALLTLLVAVALLVGGIVLAIGAIVFMIRSVARPLGNLAEVVGRLTSADEVSIPYRDRGDEIGSLARALGTFRDNFLATDAIKRDQAAAQAEQLGRAQQVATLTTAFEAKVEGIVSAVSAAAGQFAASADQMASTAEESARTANSVAAASEEASVNVQTVASATEQLTGSITEISRRVAESTRIADSARQTARATNSNVQALADAASSIGDVVKLISAIAEQTNLLALNATIEAARAGEAGRGFAVVASEVKTLAGQTAKATEQISTQIEQVQAATANAVGSIGSIAKTIEQINEIAVSIANAVEEQSSATQEISRNVRQTALGTQEVASNIVGVKDAAALTGKTADELKKAASVLRQQSGELSGEVGSFLQSVRAA
jgi:methyl-accepting chemotaxis protein